ncbi:hypothetical protein PAECIP111893_04522 [Paenibacillus plantiphilus]|uniref:Uncharacterized protein n=1 Tax=Paenibacillus plantiphilus TaxID=2905650 RepID=A0ABM9CN78_9BACL|nr:hypothetical protein [Paenibacillus plantiphilus]CAH1219228.1 hypothetical protein PAECIP111893_04522 [Paenibacillus plantiphilus]
MMSKRRRILLIAGYFLLAIWLLLFFASYESGFILLLMFPFLFIFKDTFVVFSVLFSVYLFFKSKKWLSEERLAGVAFLIPAVLIAIVIVVPILQREIDLKTKEPNDELIRSYIESNNISSSNLINMSEPLLNYHAEEKHLELYLRIDREKFFDFMKTASNGESRIMDEDTARYMMNRFYLDLINLPSNIAEATRAPEKITVYGYWGDELICTTYFEMGNGVHYRIKEPYPKVVLSGIGDEWYLQYTLNGESKDLLFREEVVPSEFSYEILDDSLIASLKKK